MAYNALMCRQETAHSLTLQARSRVWTDGSRLAPVAKYRVEPIPQAGQFQHGTSTGPVWEISGLPYIITTIIK